MEIINNITTTVDTGSVELNTDIEYIKGQCAIGRKASHEVARRLLKIKREELFSVCADNFSTFCSEFFGINKATGSKLTALAERFLVDSDNNAIDIYDNYSISQLMEMRNATDTQLSEIKPSMTVSEIREFIHPKAVLSDKSDNDKSDNDKSDKSDNDKSDNDKSKIDFEKSHSMVKLVNGNGASPSKFVGDGFVIHLNEHNTPHSAHITSWAGIKKFIEYMECTYTQETIDNNVKVNNIVIEL